jgi:uncharacterized protein (TIGR00255 family)
MQQSMTGFCNITEVYNNKRINIDIRCLNSKTLDLNVRLPLIYKELENDIRQLISKYLIRGKIDFTCSIELLEYNNTVSINKLLLKKYFNDFYEIKQELNLNTYQPDWFSFLVRMPEVIQSTLPELTDEEKQFIFNITTKTLNNVVQYRINEGNALIKDILKRVELIEKLLLEIEPFEKQRIMSIKQRIYSNLKEFMQEIQIDRNRLEQELIYYIEKMDITEEKTRIFSHCKFFKETLNYEQYAGKKLSFIAQELGREINTIGSKSQDFNIQRIVVQMKDELEKIKEQLLNLL